MQSNGSLVSGLVYLPQTRSQDVTIAQDCYGKEQHQEHSKDQICLAAQ